MNFAIDGTITKIILETMIVISHACRGFREHVSITLINKTNPSDPLKREDYWRRTLCTMASYDLNIEDHV